MNAKVIGIIGLITVILIVVTFVAVPTKDQSASNTEAEKGKNLLPGLASQLDDVNRITIERGTETLHLYREDGSWRIEEKNGYFAKEGEAEDLLVGFRSFDLVEEKTSNPEFYDKLGVADPKESDTSARVILEKGDGDKIASVILGDLRSGAGNINQRFVRIEGDKKAYLVKTNADPGGTLKSWIQTDVIDLPPARLATVEIQRWDGEVLYLDKSTSTTVDWSLADVPIGAEISNQNTVNSIGRSLARVTHEDVALRSKLNSDSFTSETLFIATGFDGVELTATLLSDSTGSENKWWAQFDLDFSENLYDAQNTDKTIDEVRTEVTDLKKNLDDWAFQLPAWKIANMTKAVDDLIEFPSEEEESAMPDNMPPSGESMSLEDLSKFLTPEQLEQLQNAVPSP